MSQTPLFSPRCVIIAGPNGAGKTTFAREFLPQDAGIIHFVNADLIEIVFLKLASPKLALRRVAGRVKQGGHNVPRDDVLRRFVRGWDNFQTTYRPLADAWAVYDNSGAMPHLLEEGP